MIEIDGGQHNAASSLRDDAARDSFLRHHDFKVLRFWNNDVIGNIDGVAHKILSALDLDASTPIPSPQGGGE